MMSLNIACASAGDGSAARDLYQELEDNVQMLRTGSAERGEPQSQVARTPEELLKMMGRPHDR